MNTKQESRTFRVSYTQKRHHGEWVACLTLNFIHRLPSSLGRQRFLFHPRTESCSIRDPRCFTTQRKVISSSRHGDAPLCSQKTRLNFSLLDSPPVPCPAFLLVRVSCQVCADQQASVFIYLVYASFVLEVFACDERLTLQLFFLSVILISLFFFSF